MIKVFAIGRITKDFELATTRDGVAFCRFSIAVKKKKDGADFFDVSVWRQTAELCYRFVKKGSKIAINGFLTVREWEKDGQKHKAVEIVAEEVEFLDSRKVEQENLIEVDENVPF